MFRQCMAALLFLTFCFTTRAESPAQASGDVTLPSIVTSPVTYPSTAVDARDEGTVGVLLLVGTDGLGTHASVTLSSGHPDLDAAALQSVTRWTFVPKKRNGKPEASWVRVPVDFKLTVASDDAEGDDDATGNAATSAAAQRTFTVTTVAGALMAYLGGPIWLIGFVWSIVLAKRRSILWLSGMVAVWLLTYPVFVAMHWSESKKNLGVVILGLSLMGVGCWLMTP
jgi:TonB family protein